MHTPPPGRYRASVRLGEGGHAVTHVGYASQGPPVALKFLRREYLDNDLLRRRFRREGEIGLLLNHPNVVTTRAMDELDGVPVLVLDLVGPSVDTVKEAITGDYDVIRWIAVEVLQALAYLEQEGVVHRDVSPANLLIDPRGRVRLADFGLATRHDGTATPGHAGGTRPYCSPELLRGERGTHASDTWSLGAVLYELVTGRLPFGRTPDSILKGHARGAPALPRKVPRDLRRAIIGLLTSDPTQRLRIDEALALLTRVGPHVAAQLGGVARSWFRRRCPGVVHPVESIAHLPVRGSGAKQRRRRAGTIPAAAVVTATACAGVWVVALRDNDGRERPDVVAVREAAAGTVELQQPTPNLPAWALGGIRPDKDGIGLGGTRQPASSAESWVVELEAERKPIAIRPWDVGSASASVITKMNHGRPATQESRTPERGGTTRVSKAQALAEAVLRGVQSKPHPKLPGGGVRYGPARLVGDDLVLEVQSVGPFELGVALLGNVYGRFRDGTAQLGAGSVTVVFEGARPLVDERPTVGIVFADADEDYEMDVRVEVVR